MKILLALTFKGNKSKLVMDILCLSLSIVLAMITAGLALGFKEKSANDMYAGYESLIEFAAGDFDKSINYFYLPCYSENNINFVRQNNNIKYVSGYKNLRLNDQMVFVNNKNISYIGNELVGANTEIIPILNSEIADGKNSLNNLEVIVGSAISQKWGINLGDTIQIPIQNGYSNYVVTGILKHKTEALFDTKAEVINNMILVNETEKLMHDVKYSAILATVYDIDKIDETASVLSEQLSKDNSVVKKLDSMGYKPVAATRKNVALMITRYIEYISLFIYFFTTIAYSIAITFIASSIATQMLDKVKESGILSAIGLTKSQVIYVNMFSSIILGTVSLLGGICIGLPLQKIICGFLGWNMHIDIISLLMAIIVCVIICPLIGMCYATKQLKQSVASLLQN